MSEKLFQSRLQKIALQPIRKSIEAFVSPPVKRNARTAERQPTFKIAFVRYAGCKGEVACLVRDMSQSGARISLNEAIGLPEEVRLFIPQLTLKLDAEVRWQRGGDVGLEFKKPDQPARRKS